MLFVTYSALVGSNRSGQSRLEQVALVSSEVSSAASSAVSSAVSSAASSAVSSYTYSTVATLTVGVLAVASTRWSRG